MVIWIGWVEGSEEDMVDGEARYHRCIDKLKLTREQWGLILFSARSLQPAAIVGAKCRCEA